MAILSKPIPWLLPKRFSSYLITPRDVVAWLRSLSWRDWLWLALCVALGLGLALGLQDPGAGVFGAGLLAALVWRVDSRWPLGAAVACLVFIPFSQLAYDRNWLLGGDTLANALAVAVWYLLAIGITRQLVALVMSRETASDKQSMINAAQAPTVSLASGTSHRRTPPAAPALAPTAEAAPVSGWSLRRQRMIARRVSARVERTRTGMDGIRRPAAR